jgi:glycosyltransferase involved in cell wall biosynthesis
VAERVAKSKNIGVVVDNAFDADIRVQKEVRLLIEEGHQVFVLCFGFDDEEYASRSDCTIDRISISRKKKNALFFFSNTLPLYERQWQKSIARFVSAHAIDILHVHDLYMSKAAHRGIKNSGRHIPFILDLHENYPHAVMSYNWTKGFLRSLISRPEAWFRKEGEYLSYPSKIIVLSDSFARDLMSRYSFLKTENMVAFPNVIDLRNFEQFLVDTSVQKSDKVTLMYFGAVAERRGIFETLNVFKKALNEELDVDLMIIGPVDKADQERFDHEAADLIHDGHLKHVSWIGINELLTYMHISDVLLSPLVKNPQHESGVANKIFQYMFGKKPILASDCGPQKELIEQFDCGLVYANADEFYSSLKKLALDEALRKRMGENGYKALYANYDNEAHKQKLLHLYD